MTDETAERLLDHSIERFDGKVEDTVKRLHEIADRIEREHKRVGVRPQPYYQRASNVVHEIMWGLANLNLENLTIAAADVDGLMREAQE